jgi:hypothetical protein
MFALGTPRRAQVLEGRVQVLAHGGQAGLGLFAGLLLLGDLQHHGGQAGLGLFAGLLLLGNLQHALYAEQAVEPGRSQGLAVGLGLQLASQPHELVQELPVDPQVGSRLGPADGQSDGHVAARAVLGRGLAGRRLECFVAVWDAAPEVEGAAVDALDFPAPGHLGVAAFAAGESGHTGKVSGFGHGTKGSSGR